MSFKPQDMDKAFASNYMRFDRGPSVIGETKGYKIRILSEPIAGYEYWLDAKGDIVPRGELAGDGGKPVRARHFADFPMEARNAMKAFAAAVVWNYELEKVQIFSVKQKAIMNGLEALTHSEGWEDVTTYDITINKTKTGSEERNVEYSVMPNKSDPQPAPEIIEAYEAANINLEALLTGDDPFAGSEDVDPNDIDL